MARTRRMIWQRYAPAVETALAALCISGLLFLSLLSGLRRTPERGIGSPGIVSVIAVTPMSEILPSSERGVSEGITHGDLDDGENTAKRESEGKRVDNTPPVMSAPTAIRQADPTALARVHDLVRSGYLPAKLLSLRPVVINDIAPDFLVDTQVADQAELILQLLINEYGDVDRVIVEDSTLSVSIMAELTQRFLQLRFFPGFLDGEAVPTALRIAVTLHPDLQP